MTSRGSRSGGGDGSDGRRRGLQVWAFLGASLVLVGAGAVLLSRSYDRSREARVAGADAPVNSGATESDDISAQNSPTVARSPVRPAQLATSSRIDTPFFSCRLHVSSDGGKRWNLTPIPAPKGEDAKCFAPDVAFAADGTLYFSFVTLKGRGNVPNAAWIATSKDGGRTLSKPVKVLGKLAFQVRLAADPVNRDRVYMTWLQGRDVASLRFTGVGNPIKSIRSDDGGDSWSRPRTVSDSARERVVAPSPVVGPKGELYVLYVDMGGDTLDYSGEHRGRGGPPYRGSFDLVLARSVDKGKTWQESVVDRRVRPISRFVVFIPPFPSVAVDRDGRVYAAFQDKRLGDSDVLLWSLARGASDWRGPKRVNDTKERDGTSQYLPKLSVAPNGRLDVLYYDRRADRARNVMNQVSLQSSFDAGRTFGPSLRVSSRAFDSRIGFGAKEGLPDLGSRLGLLSDDRRALGVWTDTRAGTPATQKQDIARASVAFTSSAERSKAAERRLRYGGLGLGLIGLALVGLWAWARGAFRHPAGWAPLRALRRFR